MGVVNPAPGFLAELRKITEEHGALLIFDEVISGFRLSYGGAQGLFGIKPDLTCLGKVIGGGLPVGAYGGRRDIMQLVAPEGRVYQAGTLSGNPLAMTAGLATLRILDNPDIYTHLEERSAALQEGIAQEACKRGLPLSIARAGSLLTVFFSGSAPMDYKSAAKCDTALFSRFFRGLLGRGIYWPPSQFEAAFVSLAHSENDISKTISTIGKVFRRL
jgi:glutamate-1-semialdehyde 2,1-aminomutase